MTHARGTIPAITFSNPQSAAGAFTGIQTLNGTYLPNLADRTFEASGTAVFAGEVEGCGVGVVYFDYRGSGTIATDGSNVFESDTYTAVPGGSLPIVGSIAQSGIDAANGDGTSTAPYSGTYACDTYGLSGSPLMRP
jgi:hypothetical protein